MSDWPPPIDELHATEPDSAVVLYPKRIWNQLEDNPNTRDRSHYEKQLLCQAIVHLDSFAVTAIGRFTFHPSELGRIAPPPAIAKDERALKRWQAERSDYQCVEAAYRARCAILAGDYIEAIDAALDAGHFSRFHLAEIGYKVRSKLPRKGSHKHQREDLTARDRDIVTEAMHLHQSRSSLSDSSVANLIAKAHVAEAGYPKAARIRQILREGKKDWKRKPCASNSDDESGCAPHEEQ